jgi:hypothetical protein
MLIITYRPKKNILKIIKTFKKVQVISETSFFVLFSSKELTSFWRARDAQPRYAGSRARRVLNRPKEDAGNSLKVSIRLDLNCGILNFLDNVNFFQYSSDGVPHSLKIL